MIHRLKPALLMDGKKLSVFQTTAVLIVNYFLRAWLYTLTGVKTESIHKDVCGLIRGRASRHNIPLYYSIMARRA